MYLNPVRRSYTLRQPMDRIPTLDGWRGIAILLVLVTHLQISLLGHLYGSYHWMDLGQHGVNLFFVLSGYLITSRLLGENKINLKAFYLRRFFRLMPCAWTYLLTLAPFHTRLGRAVPVIATSPRPRCPALPRRVQRLGLLSSFRQYRSDRVDRLELVPGQIRAPEP